MVTKQPSDRSHFILPDLGEGIHEAELIKWRVAVGDTVQEHQTLAEMETDKALVEVPSPWTGVIKSLNANEGDIVIVGSILVKYDIGSSGSTPIDPQQFAGAVSPPDTGCVVGAVDDHMTVPASFVRQSETTPTATGKILATPAVRRIARELDVDINEVAGTGRGGRVTASDVESHARPATVIDTSLVEDTPPARQEPVAPLAPDATPARHESVAPIAPDVTPTRQENIAPLATRVSVLQEGVTERIPIRGIRKKIAEALTHSLKTAAHFQVFDEADVTKLEKQRIAIGKLVGKKFSLLPFVMSAVIRGLKKHPILNSTVDDFVEEIIVHSVVNLGCAVDTKQGLMVAVIKNADTLSPVQLADETERLAMECRDRTIKLEELSGGTFTISNVGSYGGMFTTPIINYPEVAILGVGRAKEQVLTKDGAFFAGLVLPLSLSCDHRVVDGAQGARFLRTVIELLENPEELLPSI